MATGFCSYRAAILIKFQIVTEASDGKLKQFSIIIISWFGLGIREVKIPNQVFWTAHYRPSKVHLDKIQWIRIPPKLSTNLLFAQTRDVKLCPRMKCIKRVDLARAPQCTTQLHFRPLPTQSESRACMQFHLHLSECMALENPLDLCSGSVPSEGESKYSTVEEWYDQATKGNMTND